MLTRNMADNITYQDFLKTGPDTIAGRYLRQFWHPVSRVEDIAAGRAKPIKIMNESLTLYRGENGKCHILAERCAHRMAPLSLGWVEGDELRCAYHGWKYDATGQCTDQPAEPRPFCEKVRVQSYPVREYLGLVFTYLGEGTPPPLPETPEFEQEGYLHIVSSVQWPCNYYTQLDNALDYLHTAMLHWHFGFKFTDKYMVEETEYGIRTYVDGLSDKEWYYSQGVYDMPTVHEWAAPPRPGERVGQIARAWRVPVDDFHHLRLHVDVVPLKGREAEEYLERIAERQAKANARPYDEVSADVIAGRMSFADLKNGPFHPQLTNIQDYSVMVGIEPMVGRELHEELGWSDAGVILGRKIWERELTAFRDGKPQKQWKRPEYLWAEVWQREATPA